MLALTLALALLLGGCAALRGQPEPVQAADSAEPARQPLHVTVQAPPELQTLLLRHLDIVRLGDLARDDASIDDGEWTRLIEAAPAQARELLQTEGYFAPRIEVQRRPGSGRGDLGDVELIVDTGPRAIVTRTRLEMQGDLEAAAEAGNEAARALTQSLRQDWPMPPGSAFRNADWSDAKASTLARLRAAGYVAATWSGTAAEVDPLEHTVRMFVVADSGPLFLSGPLRIEGLREHDAATVHNLADFEPGTPVTEDLLLDFQERLQGAGLFETSSVTLDPDPATAADAPILVRLREAPMQVYTFGVGISANNGPRASVQHVYRRVFGYAATARNHLEWAERRRAWDGELSTHTLPGLNRYLVGGAIEWLQSPDDETLSQRLRVGRAHDDQRFERLSFLEAERSSRTITTGSRSGVSDSDTVALSANHHIVKRELDSVILPTFGYTLALQGGAGYAHGTGSESGPFGRLYGRLTGYLPLGDTWHGQAQLELGQIILSDGVLAPESQRFRAGGSGSVRGYAYRSLGPLVDGAVSSGDVLFTTSVEVARPILASMPSLWGALFVDAGNAANDWDSLSPVLGYGFGVRWRSPVGPLQVDLAWGHEVQKLRLHFSVGVAF
jgi:translocation and assembly module TamA